MESSRRRPSIDGRRSLARSRTALHDQIWGGRADGGPAPEGPGEDARRAERAEGVAPIVVSVTPAKRADFPIVLESLGQVQPYNTVLVRARVDGEIVKIAFKEGQIVQQGDLLAQIDPRPFQAALDQAVAKKAQDEATVANAKLDLTRYATLAKQNFATQQQLDTQNALVNQLTATIAADAAAIDAASVQLGYTAIRAPITGRAGFRLIDEGNLVNAGQQTGIVSIAQLQPIAVIFTEPQEYVDRINQELAAGAPAVTVLNADGDSDRDRQADDQRQSGRPRDRNDPPEGGIRECQQRPVARSGGHDALAARRHERCGRRPRGHDPAWKQGLRSSILSATTTARRSGR